MLTHVVGPTLIGLQARVEELEFINNELLNNQFPLTCAYAKIKIENARLRKVVELLKEAPFINSQIEEALRELDGEKKCDSCGMPDSDLKSVICNDGFHTPKD